MNKTKKRTEPTTLYLGHVKFHRMCAPRNVIIACKHVGLALSVSSKQHSNPIQNITEVFLDAFASLVSRLASFSFYTQ